VNEKKCYKIRLKNKINTKKFSRFEKVEISCKEGDTEIYGYFDETALYSILKRIRDLNIKLLKLELVEDCKEGN